MKHWHTDEDAIRAVRTLQEHLYAWAEEAERRRKMHAGDRTLPESIRVAARYANLSRSIQSIAREIGNAISLHGLETVIRDVYARESIEAESSSHVGMSLGVVRQYGTDGTEVLGMTHDASKKGAA